MKHLIFVVTISLFSPLLAAQCQNNSDMLGANYFIETKDNKTGKVIRSHTLNFWRMNKQVAYINKQQKMAEVWNLVSNGRIRPIRYFDEYQRGIEYQPDDINKGLGDTNWQVKYQIISDNFLKTLKIVDIAGGVCDQIEHYKGSVNQVTWLTHYKLPKSIVTQKNQHTVTWTLESLELDQAKVSAAFIQRNNYLLTDYADIGDNESDPFILKMINLGFVEHGASGFYDSKGKQMGAASHQH